MVTIIFESHGTTVDNENHIASGANDVNLSILGEEQAKELGKRHTDDKFDAIFVSDLIRSSKTAEIAFGNKFPIIKDSRLRECNYGDFNGHPEDEVKPMKPNKIEIPFPNGESYEQTTKRIKSFLEDLLQNYDEKEVMVIGHRATQYGLENLIKNVSLIDVINAKWNWQPGWKYILERI